MFLAHEFSRKGRKSTNMKAPSSSFISGSAQLWFSDESDQSDQSDFQFSDPSDWSDPSENQM